QLVPDQEPGATQHVVHKSTPPVAEAVAPAAVSSPTRAAPPAPVAAPQPATPATPEEQPARVNNAEPVAEPSIPEEEPGGAAPQQDPDRGSPLLTRVLEHIPGTTGDPAPRPPQ